MRRENKQDGGLVSSEIKGTARSEVVGMKNWSDEKQRWHGVICQVRVDGDGEEFVQVYDVGSAETQVEIEDWLRDSIATRPWDDESSR